MGYKYYFQFTITPYGKEIEENIEKKEKIVETYKNYKEIENYSYIANYKEIKNNDYDLNISKYIQNKYEIEKINQDDTQKSIYNLEQERKEIQKQIEKLIQQIK